MHHDAACWALVAVEEMLHDAAFAKCVQALCDGGGIDEEAAAKCAADVRVELSEGELGLFVIVAPSNCDRFLMTSTN